MSQHAKLQAKLEQRLAELTARAREIDEDLSERADDDWDENAIGASDDEVQEIVGLATLTEVRLIRQALAALADGTYGTCSECGGKISAERLKAFPEANCCRACA